MEFWYLLGCWGYIVLMFSFSGSAAFFLCFYQQRKACVFRLLHLEVNSAHSKNSSTHGLTNGAPGLELFTNELGSGERNCHPYSLLYYFYFVSMNFCRRRAHACMHACIHIYRCWSPAPDVQGTALRTSLWSPLWDKTIGV